MYDAIIVGARCAGASLAIFLAQRGYRLLLIDRDTFPSDTISTHITGEIEVYERLGVLEKLEAAGAPPLTRMRIDLEGNVFESDLIVTPRSLGLRRYQFDMIMLEQALSYGNVEWLENTSVTDLLFEEGRVAGVRYRTAEGEAEARACVVVGADGRHSTVAKRVAADCVYRSEELRPAYYAYFEHVMPLPIPTVEWYWNEGDILFCTPTDGGLHSILVMPTEETMELWKDNPRDRLLERISRVRNLAERTAIATMQSSVRGIGRMSMQLLQAYGPGWALLGDAGGLVHPVSGTGMDDAVCSAEFLAESLAAYFCSEKDWVEAMEAYKQKRDDRLRPQFGRVLNTFERAVPLPNENIAWLRLICTFPSIVHDIGVNAKSLMDHLDAERTEFLSSMVLMEKRKIGHEKILRNKKLKEALR